MTQQHRSTTSTPASAEDTDAADARPPLAEPRPPAEHRVWPRTFHDRLTAPLPGLKAFARFAREGAVRPGPAGLADIPRLPYAPGPLPRVDARTVAVTWAGHASWVVRIGGLTVLTDPVWSRRILGTPPRVTPVGVAWSALPRVDAVVISHNHYDHLDLALRRPSPRSPGPARRAPRGTAAACRARARGSDGRAGGRRAVRSPAPRPRATPGAAAPRPAGGADGRPGVRPRVR
ncbi:hypothetical protein SVIOM342S_08981 [Streptomyces violaceorubidus]